MSIDPMTMEKLLAAQIAQGSLRRCAHVRPSKAPLRRSRDMKRRLISVVVPRA